ncbi:DNA-dependent RNA polymerase [Xanthomonas phage Xaa_vB_phi31]|uniref:DNA-directed RNA polymerase n=1 Tax=Xanthomonas phage Xaa_vB_phi31 TaxID=2776752 RepID=A0A868BZ22_9CAUD|nr:DNA-dependent RNA polymerase [Xanthomonas phage Xaa_vB_phi31]
MQTQQELEEEMYAYGRTRMADSIAANEEKGRAEANPYAQKLYRTFLFPLRDVLVTELSERKPGRRQAHAALLSGMDMDAVAYLAVRNALSNAMADISVRAVAIHVGKAVYHEYLLCQFEDAKPELFHYLLNDIDRRMSSDERYKMNVMRNQATKAGVEFKEWGNAHVQQIGYYLIDKLVQVGMLVVTNNREGAMNHVEVSLSEAAEAIVSQITEFVTEMAPYWTPCVEQPKDWTSLTEGGYHTDGMRRLDPYLVHTHGTARRFFEMADMSQEYKCVNALQATKWRVNRDLLDIATNVSYHFDMEEILMQAEFPKPQRPTWLVNQKQEEMDENQLKSFRAWKREMASWHTDAKLRKLKGYRFANIMREARKFADYPAIYFVYFMDFRGRKYVKSNGISPQGSDLQKAMLEFGEGKPLLTPGAKDWFMITGANRFGVDKVSYEDRIQWVKDNEHLILDWARNPVDAADWMEADKPFQFLAWCLEYAKWKAYGDKFLSRISAGMDGSCNGLQNFSAMLRDPVGGRAVNLLPSLLPNDIYQMVADRATTLLQQADEDDQGFRSLWLSHVLTRSLVKRSVMTLPYGSKRTSCKDFIIKDYLKAGKFKELDPAQYEKAAAYLSFKVWEAIGDVVVKAREAMDWLQQSARTIIKAGDENIRWMTPTGFPVVQVYFGTIEHRINTKLAGNMKIQVVTESDETNLNRHKNGIAPNFVHSLDASHLTGTTLRCVAEGMTAFHMVHDDYGTHAADAPAMFRAIREVFVGMYQQHDMLQELRDAYGLLSEPPAQGDLDLTQVIDSPYFFG